MDEGWDNNPTNVDAAGDYSTSKPGLGALYHENQVATAWGDSEPLITPDKLKRVHLFGIPLVSAIRDPLTNRPQLMDDTLLKEFITEAVGLAELESKVEIFPRQYVEKQAFDRAAYDMFGFMLLKHRPVSSLEAITVTASNELPIYSVPLSWVDVGHLRLGQLNLIPLTIALKTGTVVPLSTSPGGSAMLSIFGNKPWIPSFWEVTYTCGFKEGLVPKIINQYIGVIAAMEALSVLATTYSRSNSMSLSIDGLSQSLGMPGGEVYKIRLEELAEKRRWLKSRIQAAFGMSFFSDNV
jgi:hypothetical protein